MFILQSCFSLPFCFTLLICTYQDHSTGVANAKDITVFCSNMPLSFFIKKHTVVSLWLTLLSDNQCWPLDREIDNPSPISLSIMRFGSFGRLPALTALFHPCLANVLSSLEAAPWMLLTLKKVACAWRHHISICCAKIPLPGFFSTSSCLPSIVHCTQQSAGFGEAVSVRQVVPQFKRKPVVHFYT